MLKNSIRQQLQVAINASIIAGEEILAVYNSNFEVEQKEDKSPLTLADKNAHNKISQHLKDTDIPLLSEEGRDIPYEERKKWPLFWMVDPLDGTKEFVKRNGEFTVNIALIEDGKPILGVIYVPVKRVLYFAGKGVGAFKKEGIVIADLRLNWLLSHSRALPLKNNLEKFTVVASRSHPSVETTQLIEQLSREHGQVETVSMGSSLKLCLVAEGVAHIYPRYAPTMEWDTAAGQAIAECAGKMVIDYNTNEPLNYNKQNLRNNWFTVK